MNVERNFETNDFSPILLSNTGKVSLLNRMDTKYWFPIKHLDEVLRRAATDYFVLTIDGETNLDYATQYFDTPEDKFYLDHHSGRLNRVKVRRRYYLQTGVAFLEIKQKSSKGKTNKIRFMTNGTGEELALEEQQFLSDNTDFDVTSLQAALYNKFTRITLVSKRFDERCTVDFNLKYIGKQHEEQLSSLVIVEVKSDGKPINSSIVKILQSMRIRGQGFSKYCIGRALINQGVKKSAFKPKLHHLKKILTV